MRIIQVCLFVFTFVRKNICIINYYPLSSSNMEGDTCINRHTFFNLLLLLLHSDQNLNCFQMFFFFFFFLTAFSVRVDC